MTLRAPTHPLQVRGLHLCEDGAVEADHVPLEQDHEVVIGMELMDETLVKLLKLNHFEVVQAC